MFRQRFLSGMVGLCIIITGLFAQIPKPEDVLGFKVGADYHLADYNQALEYFRLLAEKSHQIEVLEMGKTSMGKPMLYAVISSENNIKKLDYYKDISRKLSLVEGLSEAQARSLAAEGKAIVWIDVGIHATECAPTQHALQLAYDLITDKDSVTQMILDNTILLLVFANPDGMQLVADWYHPHVETPFETSPLPWVYNRYVGHDNNRDSYMNNLLETQNITHLLNQEWYPLILFDHHQTAPFPARIWIPPAAEPTNPNLHPLFIRGKNLIGSAMGYAFDREGKDGAISRFAFDFIYPGYEDSFGDFFHIISIMTETALYRYATPRFYSLQDFPEAYRDFLPSVFYPSPWKGGWWRLSDAVEYCLTASKSVLHTAALYRDIFLMGKYQMGQDIIKRFSQEPPYAWIIPQQQWDAPTAALLIEKMLIQGIKVSQAEKTIIVDGVSYPAGTWVIPMNQPFALFVKAVFEEQTYPDLSKYPTQWQGVIRPQRFADAYIPPYDMAGWSLPLQMGVKAIPANSPINKDLTPVKKAVFSEALEVPKAGYAYHLSPRTNNSYIATNRILAQGGKILRTQEAMRIQNKSYPAGSLLVLASDISLKLMRTLVNDLSLQVTAIHNPVAVKSHHMFLPRVALYKSWQASMDEGWTRWLFEQYEFAFSNIQDAEIKAGLLKNKFDVLVIPAMSSDAIINGHKPGTMPPDYVGGISDAGIRNIRHFIEAGGTLVTLNSACLFAMEKLGIPVRNALQNLGRGSIRYGNNEAPAQPVKFACPGSILRMNFDPTHPVAYGMPEQAPGVFYRSPAFQVLPVGNKISDPEVIAHYPKEELLMSGYLKGEKFLRNRAAAVEVPMGKGKVILLGFGVQSRAQPHGTFKLLFNSLFYSAYK